MKLVLARGVKNIKHGTDKCLFHVAGQFHCDLCLHWCWCKNGDYTFFYFFCFFVLLGVVEIREAIWFETFLQSSLWFGGSKKMAEATVSFAVGRLGELLVQEAGFLYTETYWVYSKNILISTLLFVLLFYKVFF